jgi:sulfur relay (sulfurtransferase) complex TusBCD TusD component (DsrE family)
VGAVTTATVSGLISGAKYYFAVKAYDVNGLESPYSAEVSYTAGTGGTTGVPTIALSSPSTGSSYTAPAAIDMSANVSANGHTITKVQFYNGSTLLAEDTSAPYSNVFNVSAAGTYSLTAKAVYDSGSVVTSTPVSVSVNTAPVAQAPTIAITSPASGSTFAAPATVSVAASVIPNGHTITKVQFFNGSSLLAEDTASPYSYTASNVGVGTYNVTATAVYDAGSIVTSAPVKVTVSTSTVTNAPAPTLPAPWVSRAIGSVTAGSASASNGIYTVSGAGNVSGSADNFQFVYQPMSGDGEIRAQIRSVQSTAGTGGIAGVMMRETLTTGSSFVCMGTAPGGTGYAEYRASTGAAMMAATSGASAPPNAWVRLVRTGSTFYGYRSADGVNWQLVNSGPVSMGSTIYFGLAVASGSSSTLNTSSFGSVTAVP